MAGAKKYRSVNAYHERTYESSLRFYYCYFEDARAFVKGKCALRVRRHYIVYFTKDIRFLPNCWIIYTGGQLVNFILSFVLTRISKS